MGTMGTGRALTLNQQGSPLTGKSEGLLPELLNRSIISSMNLNNAINYHTDILEKSSPPLGKTTSQVMRGTLLFSPG